jgi:hypothetical protein
LTGERKESEEFRTGEREATEGYMTEERVASEVFAAAQALLGRDFTTSEREAVETFQAQEAATGREFVAGENVLGREFQTGERVGGEAFRTGERVAGQEYGTGEREATEAYRTGEREAIQGFDRDERIAGEAFRTNERIGSQAFATSENALDRLLKKEGLDVDRLREDNLNVYRNAMMAQSEEQADTVEPPDMSQLPFAMFEYAKESLMGQYGEYDPVADQGKLIWPTDEKKYSDLKQKVLSTANAYAIRLLAPSMSYAEIQAFLEEASVEILNRIPSMEEAPPVAEKEIRGSTTEVGNRLLLQGDKGNEAARLLAILNSVLPMIDSAEDKAVAEKVKAWLGHETLSPKGAMSLTIYGNIIADLLEKYSRPQTVPGQ